MGNGEDGGRRKGLHLGMYNVKVVVKSLNLFNFLLIDLQIMLSYFNGSSLQLAKNSFSLT